MKNLCFLVTILISLTVDAQIEKPVVKDLAYFVPQNPKQSSDFYVGYPLRNKQSEYIYNKDGILTDYKFVPTRGTMLTASEQYISPYNKNGIRIKEQKISSSKNKNSLYGYVITYRDGSVEAPENANLKFVNEHKKDNVVTKAAANFTSQEGYFEKGTLSGPGIVNRNGIEIKGNFKNGKLSGFGQKTFNLGGNQRITLGNYKNDLLDGYGFLMEVDNKKL